LVTLILVDDNPETGEVGPDCQMVYELKQRAAEYFLSQLGQMRRSSSLFD
jgi:hypothetical protein